MHDTLTACNEGQLLLRDMINEKCNYMGVSARYENNCVTVTNDGSGLAGIFAPLEFDVTNVVGEDKVFGIYLVDYQISLKDAIKFGKGIMFMNTFNRVVKDWLEVTKDGI